MAKRNAQARARARELRGGMSEPERALWEILRAGRLQGIKFVRQLPVGPYIADFAARSERLIVVLDGETHALPGAAEHDATRTAALEAEGWRVIRFGNNEVMTNPEGLARAILMALGRDL
ncbi:endonuclease domain-containing protein [Sphingomonas canadensis]|uniref:Endonuclease domain-containing protein n=1 Tax=Sphingomonas canadensis TaxID=1219257 RepID=A0ABW3HC12_9SPHN|nr:endonuclease domain-containing protein [Sphingomonas canadensis]MCW3836848.1 endonuclease domain-containing protein [Sphingomonas canadensis]